MSVYVIPCIIAGIILILSGISYLAVSLTDRYNNVSDIVIITWGLIMAVGILGAVTILSIKGIGLFG